MAAARKKSVKKKEQKLEEALEKLREIVEKLENEDVDIDEGFALFEEGSKLAKFCSQKLSGYERKVRLVKKKALEGADDEDEENAKDGKTGGHELVLFPDTE